MNEEKHEIMIANITWNESGWRSVYADPRAGHEYARKYPGHESLNFEFNKRGLDDKNSVYGFVQWTNAPARFKKDGFIFFYSRNLNNGQGEIVGIYGQARILEASRRTKWNGFEKNELISNIVASKHSSTLFPIPLKSERYSNGNRLVPQCGFTYKDNALAEKILRDELSALQESGIRLEEFKKLANIYELITGTKYITVNTFQDIDTKEQDDLLSIISKNREQILNELRDLSPEDPQEVIIKGKTYKRDNKTIAQLKHLKEYKCQICNTYIIKKNKTHYIEAAHILGKRHKGSETPDNILILCPNHHKEFDLGDKEIIKHTKDNFIFRLNGKEYKIDLSLK